ncbi:MAG: ATP-binding protein [Chloroflexota bacterium]
MSKPPLQEKIDALKSALRSVKPERPTDAASQGLRAAHQYLNELADELKVHEDQIRLSALYKVSQVLGTSLDLDQVLTQVMDAVIGLTGAERGFLVLLEAASKDWKLRAARNLSQETLERQDMAISRTVIDTVLESGEGLVTTDARSDPRFSETESVVFYALRSIMCAPLMARGQVIGAIYVDNRAQVGLFEKDDLEMLGALAAQAAIAIENARLYTTTDQALAQRVTELETLAQMDRELNRRLDLGHVLEITHRWVMRHARAGQVWVILAEDGNLEGEVTTYPADELDLKDALVLRAFSESTDQNVPATDGDPARLAMPILRGSKLMGAVLIQREETFDQGEIEFLGYLLGRAGTAIQNAQLYDAVQKMSDAKTQFISVVTHELRVPMTSIKGYADLLRQGVVGSVNEQQVSFLDVIRSNVERMSTLVSDLSDISKIESGRIKVVSSLIPLRVYVEDALRSLRPKMDEKQLVVDVDVSGDLPQVYADYNRLMQILTNLLSNAAKFTPEGGHIQIAAHPQADMMRVEVTDTGIGISHQDQSQIFSQFFRSEDPAVRNEAGWGLGLSVTKRLVELMGGTIGFNSELGQGTTFWFTLPTSAPPESSE